MAVTYVNEPVIDLVRQLIDTELTEDGDSPVVIPDDYLLDQYKFVPANCPLTVIRVRQQIDEQRKPCVNDVTHWLKLTIYHVRQRESADVITEDVAASRIDSMAAYFFSNPRLAVAGHNNVQRTEICNRLTGVAAAMDGSFIPIEQLAGLAVASMELQLCWIENLITS